MAMDAISVLSNPTAVAGVFGVLGVVALLKYVSSLNGKRASSLLHTRKLGPLPKFSSTDPDIVVIGGGILGASFAARFGMEGKKVVMIERNMGIGDTFRGELLLPGGINALEKLGLKGALDDVDGNPIAGPIFYDITLGGDPAFVYYPKPGGMAMRHGLFENALRKKAMEQKSVTVIEAVGKELIMETGRTVGVKYRKKGDDEVLEVRAPLVVVADGYYSKLATEFRTTHQPISDSFVIGFLLDNYPFQNGKQHVEVAVGHPNDQVTAVAIYQVNERDTRTMIFGDGPTPSNLKAYCEEIVPHLPDHMQESFADSIKNSRLSVIRCKRIAANFDDVPGLLILGDALNTRHPVTASGMTVALQDIYFWWDALTNKVNGLTDDASILEQKLIFRKERQKWAFVANVYADISNRLLGNHDGLVRRLQQFMIKTLRGIPKEDASQPNIVYNLFGGVESDPTVLKNALDETLAGTIAEIYESQPYLLAVWEAMKTRRIWNAILREIMTPEAMT